MFRRILGFLNRFCQGEGKAKAVGSFGAKPATGKHDGGMNTPPPEKPVDTENCPHNVLVKQVKPNQELRYVCMKCGQPFKKPDELPRPQFAGGEK